MIRAAIAGTIPSPQDYFNIIRNTPGFLITGRVWHGQLTADEPSHLPVIMPTKKSEFLVSISDALVVTDNAGLYYDDIVKFLKRSRHVLIIPDPSLPFQKVKKLTKIAEEAGVIIHFHHNSMDCAIKDKILTYIPRPEFISVNCSINKRNPKPEKDLFEILIREICLLFDLNPFNPRRLSASSVPFCSADPDLINVRIEFENGTSAIITISSYAQEESRILEIYNPHRMIRHNFNNQSFNIFDNEFPEPVIIKPEDIRSNQMKDDVFIRFFKNINKDLLSGSRFSNGIVAYQTAGGIIDQIMPCPVVN